jgi:hypothetical protein
VGAQRQDRNPAKQRPQAAAISTRTLILAGIALASLFFGLGLAASGWMGPGLPEASVPPPPPLTTSAAKEPEVVLDPSAVQLLPDASLQLDLPPGFDAGEGP